MHLCIDVGNTRWKTGIFEHGELIKFHAFNSNQAFDEISSLLYNHSIDNTIYSSVRFINKEIVDLLDSKTRLTQFDHKTPLPISNEYLSPQTLGLDRLAAIMGVFGDTENALVIDAGTCITYDLLIDGARYLGGNISPGLDMRFRAVNTFTDKLPRLEQKQLTALYGRTTDEAIEIGIGQGICHEIEGFIDQYGDKYTSIKVFITGGDSNYLVEYLKKKIFVRPNLVLEGLSKILIHNVNEK